MTVRRILSAMLRRWYVPLAVIACAALVTVLFARDGGTYTTRTVISFMRAGSTSLSPANGTNDLSVIAFAGAVVLETNNGRAPASYSVEDAPFYGAGIREGVLVELSNSGNQWVSTFSKAEIELQIVGRTEEWVAATQTELITKILNIADRQQAAVDASADSRITAVVVPLTSHIDHVAATRSAQMAAAGAMIVAALIVSAWGSVAVDRWRARRRPTDKSAPRKAPTRTTEGSPA